MHDSQFNPLIPWFAETFRRVVFLTHWEPADAVYRIIATEKPDIVLHELVERSLRALATFSPPEDPKVPAAEKSIGSIEDGY